MKAQYVIMSLTSFIQQCMTCGELGASMWGEEHQNLVKARQ